jgi:hypothetical protein
LPRKGYRRCKGCGKNRQEQFFVGKRGTMCSTCRKRSRSKASHEQRVMRTYGLASGEYERLLHAQDGACAICKQRRSYRLNVDHSHATGVVRGLLCRLCNGRLLSAARDRPEILRAAIDYLESPPAVRHLGERYYQG